MGESRSQEFLGHSRQTGVNPPLTPPRRGIQEKWGMSEETGGRIIL